VKEDVCDVLVVGAGPAGSALAARLAAAGMDVVLVEAAAHPRPKTCAEYASPRIADELRLLGVPDRAWRPGALPLRGMRVIRGADVADVRYADRSGPRPAWAVERQSFDAALADHAVAAGARLEERTAFVGVDWRHGRPVAATLRSAGGFRSARFRWLVGADGARSRVAARLGVGRPAFPRRLGLVAHYSAVPTLGDHGEMHVGRGWYVGLAPLAGGRLNVGMALPLDGHSRRPAEARFEEAIRGLPAVAERLRGARRLSPLRGAAPIGSRVSRAAGAGWLLVGDAAGFIDPFTGEGIYRALRSSRAASSALLAGGDDLSGVAERYAAERRRAFAAKDGLTWLVQGMLAAGPVMGYALRRLAQRPGLADTLGAALGDCRPASDALSPAFLARVLRP
jgi:geranylgeranyl reductase family protein